MGSLLVERIVARRVHVMEKHGSPPYQHHYQWVVLCKFAVKVRMSEPDSDYVAEADVDLIQVVASFSIDDVVTQKGCVA